MRARLHTLGRTAGPERPAGTYARQILSRLLVDLSWASSRLEGNTYTHLDTQNLIELGRRAPGKDQREAQMILNHKAAIEMLVENVDEVGFNRYTLCNLHALLAEGLLPDRSAAGRLRKIEVAIHGTSGLLSTERILVWRSFTWTRGRAHDVGSITSRDSAELPSMAADALSADVDDGAEEVRIAAGANDALPRRKPAPHSPMATS